MVRAEGFEPPTFRFVVGCSIQLSYARIIDRDEWWVGLDSNQRRETRRIYSPQPLTARPPTHIRNGTEGSIRVPCWLPIPDSNQYPSINSRALYH